MQLLRLNIQAPPAIYSITIPNLMASLYWCQFHHGQ